MNRHTVVQSHYSKDGESEGGKNGWMEGGREVGREGGWKGGRLGGKEGGKEGGREDYQDTSAGSAESRQYKDNQSNLNTVRPT